MVWGTSPSGRFGHGPRDGYEPKRQRGYGQHEQHDEQQQSQVTANGCADRPSVLACRSSSVSVNSVNIEPPLLSVVTTVEAEGSRAGAALAPRAQQPAAARRLPEVCRAAAPAAQR